MVLEQNAIQIPLNKHSQSVYYSGRPDVKLLDQAIYILAAGAQVSSEMLRSHFPPVVKIGPVEEITQLVSVGVAGDRYQRLAGSAKANTLITPDTRISNLTSKVHIGKKCRTPADLRFISVEIFQDWS